MSYSDNDWFSGFADGEGCFSWILTKGKISPMFALAVRADDSELILDIAKEFGGSVNWLSKDGSPSKPQIALRVLRKSELSFLKSYFEKFPLRSKKKRDFDVWARMVDLFVESRQGSGSDQMKKLCFELRSGRVYVSPDEDLMSEIEARRRYKPRKESK